MRKLFLIIFFIPFVVSAQTPMFKLLAKKASSGPTVYLQDFFTGTNGTNLTAHTMDVGPGWTAGQEITCAVTSTNTIQSNKAQFGLGLYTKYFSDAGISDGVASVDLTIPNTNNYLGALLFRYSNCTNYWFLAIERDAGGTPYMGIYEFQASVITLRASVNVTGATNSTLNIKVTLSGNSIVALAGTSETCNYSSSFNATATIFGLWGYDDNTTYTPVIPLDNFLVTN